MHSSQKIEGFVVVVVARRKEQLSAKVPNCIDPVTEAMQEKRLCTAYTQAYNQTSNIVKKHRGKERSETLHYSSYDDR